MRNAIDTSEDTDSDTSEATVLSKNANNYF